MEQNHYQSKYIHKKSLYDTIKSKKNVSEKRLNIGMLRIMFERKININIHKISTKAQLAYALTKKVHQLRNYLIYCKMVLLTHDINYICSLLDGIDIMRSTEQPIVHCLNLLCLINKLLNLIILSG